MGITIIRWYIIALLLCFGCNSSSSSKADDGGPDTSLDSGKTDDASSSFDADSDSAGDVDGSGDWCDDIILPPANGPDGCRRILLTKNSQGQAFITESFSPVISRDGSLVVFTAHASGHHNSTEDFPKDTNEFDDVYSVDLITMEMEVVSVSSAGEIGNDSSYAPSVTADGRYVVFLSDATNFSENDTNNYEDIFIRDRLAGTTKLVSVSNKDEIQNGSCGSPLISADGNFIVFTSLASNLVSGDTNGKNDLFIHDIEQGITERITVANDGSEADEHAQPAIGISDDGRYILFQHESSFAVHDTDQDDWGNYKRLDVYLYDRIAKKNTLISIAPDGYSDTGSQAIWLSPDGTRILFQPGGASHYHPNAVQGQMLLVTVGSDEYELVRLNEENLIAGGRGISDDERYVIYDSRSTGFVEHQAPTPDGRWIENGYVTDRDTGDVFMINASEDGTPGVIPDYVPWETDMIDYVEISMSGDGKRIVFSTIQYGIVDDCDIPCIGTPRLIYLRDCR